jgi:hypothetical protein
MEEDIVFERQPKNTLSQRRRNQRHSLNANDIMVRKQLMEMIDATVLQRQLHMESLFFLMILDDDDDDHDDNDSSMRSNDDDDDFLFMLCFVYESYNTFIGTLLDLYWNMFGVPRGVYNQLPRNPPPQNRTIDGFGPEEDVDGDVLERYTNFNKAQMHKLYDLFFEEEEFASGFVSVLGHRISLEFSLIIGLYYMKCGTRHVEMQQNTFGGEQTSYSFHINFLYDHLYSKYFHKICGDAYKLYLHQTDEFREAIYRTMFEPHLDNYPVEDHRLFGFVDGKMYKTCRPGGSGVADTIEEREDLNALQQAFYTHYGKEHGLKAQIVTLPNGMYGHLYVTNGAQNDRGLINLSGIQEGYRRSFDESGIRVRGFYPVLGGDDTYPHTEIVIRSYRGEDDGGFRQCFKSARERVEHHLGLAISLWRLLTRYHLHKILERDVFLKRLVVAHFLTNCKSCFDGNTVSSAFQCPTPDIEEYLAGPHRYHGN